MNLIIDIGNTDCKLAVFNGSSIVLKERMQAFQLDKVIDLFRIHSGIDRILISNVAQNLPDLGPIQKIVPVHVLTHQSVLPFKTSYASTLGTDRMANAAGLMALNPSKNALSIDIGTCIKFDFVDNTGIYLGGAISPGISLRFKAMNDYTARLPLVNWTTFPDYFIGGNTNESLISGVFQGIRAEIDGLITEYQSRYNDLITVVTGGDAQYFAPALKSNIFANSDLTLIGLNKIADLNV